MGGPWNLFARKGRNKPIDADDTGRREVPDDSGDNDEKSTIRKGTHRRCPLGSRDPTRLVTSPSRLFHEAPGDPSSDEGELSDDTATKPARLLKKRFKYGYGGEEEAVEPTKGVA
jgi:hypothetical protein